MNTDILILSPAAMSRHHGVAVRFPRTQAPQIFRINAAGRNMGHIATIAPTSGNVIFAGGSYRTFVQCPISHEELQALVTEKLAEILERNTIPTV